MWSNSGPHFGVHIWTQKWGQPSENFVAARKYFASRFATQQLEHECQHIPFSRCASQGRLLLYKKQIGTHGEKKHALTLTLMLVRRKSACKTSAGSSNIFWWLAPLLGPNLDPKTGPKQRPKRRHENVIQFWTPFWGPYLDPKMGSAIGEFRCCPQMFCKQICDPAAWTWMSTHTFFSLCVPRPLATVEVPLSQPCFEHFFQPCFRGHDEAGLLAFEALRGSPRPARDQASDAKRNGTDKARLTGTRIYIKHVKTEWSETKKRWRWSPVTSQDIHCFHESLQSKMRTHAPCGTLTSKHMQIFVPRYVPSLLRNKKHTTWPPWPHLHVILHFFSR